MTPAVGADPTRLIAADRHGIRADILWGRIAANAGTGIVLAGLFFTALRAKDFFVFVETLAIFAGSRALVDSELVAPRARCRRRLIAGDSLTRSILALTRVATFGTGLVMMGVVTRTLVTDPLSVIDAQGVGISALGGRRGLAAFGTSRAELVIRKAIALPGLVVSLSIHERGGSVTSATKPSYEG